MLENAHAADVQVTGVPIQISQLYQPTDGDPEARRYIPSTLMKALSGRSIRASPWKADLLNEGCPAALDCRIAAVDGLEGDAAWRLVCVMISPDGMHPTRAFNDSETETNNPP